MNKPFNIYEFLKTRPLSWSSLSSFEWDRAKEKITGEPQTRWYNNYILGIKEGGNEEMRFGKKVADSLGTKNPLAPFTLYPVVEQKLQVVFDKIPMIGFMDTYDPKTHNFREFKTSKTL